MSLNTLSNNPKTIKQKTKKQKNTQMFSHILHPIR